MRGRIDTTGSSSRVASGISAARDIIEATPVRANRFDYLDALAQALEKEKDRRRREDDDEDGWALGGVSTVLNRVLEERAAFGPFEISFDPRDARKVARYVARNFFSVRELPQALARMILTREFGMFVGVPLGLLAAASLLPPKPGGWDSLLLERTLNAVAVFFLIGGLLRIATYGRAAGIACYAESAAPPSRRLVGGVRLRVQARTRTLWIAGLFVQPQARGAGIGTALILAVLKLAQRDAVRGPVTVRVFAPAHPASKAIVAHQMDGATTILVTQPLSARAAAIVARLEAGCSGSGIKWALQPLRWPLGRATFRR